jgi:cyclophilin family peptidyl-prolyl cis-trans isomerase
MFNYSNMKATTILIIIVIITILYISYTAYSSYTGLHHGGDIDKELFLASMSNRQLDNIKSNSGIKMSDKKLKIESNLIMKLRIDGLEDIQSVELKLYDEIVPLTCKNFRTISTKGINNTTYSGNIFHRVIKGFMLQGGDIINNDGSGSISIFGDSFEDENFNVKHTKKGLLSMANSGPDTNGSQFFITTDATPHLDGKHVVFGEVVKGYNIIEYIENLSTDSSDKPYQSITIVSISNK